MKQFKNILSFELSNYYNNKAYIGFTIFLVVVIGVFLFSPRFISAFTSPEDPTPENFSTVVISTTLDNQDEMYNFLAPPLAENGIELTIVHYTIDELSAHVKNGDYSRGIYLEDLNNYTTIVNDISLFDNDSIIIKELITSYIRYDTAMSVGATPDQTQNIIQPQVNEEVINLGVDQSTNFLYTYILIFLLYMAVIMYGQYIIMGVVTEKTSRAMELLITSAKPTTFMFAKVIGSGIAGLLQLTLLLGSAYLFFNLNYDYWIDNMIVTSIFNFPPSLIIYMLIFFLAGFFLYAFLFGAAGSLASKIEDTSTLITPVMLCFVASFMITMISLSSGNVNSTLIYVASFVPLTSPMAMFTRIAMSQVPMFEIVISIAILIITTVFIGILSAKIYRVGVLFYGNKPSLLKAIKMIMKNR